ncbi:type I-C CRISPR-associated protein Cas5c [Nocardia nova]|uniref:type I-C CRISPR-associated protein Cas5c n=1 Tax=Nocardia nova TaxID=37330 RepID=UPI001C4814A8|nr:type I-C CRISPR-associated protein Cas5c [Nocardia nova]MBV7706459.1 type I-C CRISPR-associated protein Cas5c [Nocardia nova]
MSVVVEVRGAGALFTQPGLSAERVTYPVMTPSAAVGVLSAIYWKPEIAYRIEKIEVLNPIRTFTLRRNETTDLASLTDAAKGARTVDTAGNRVQRNALCLNDVAYRITAHVDVQPHARKPAAAYLSQVERRIERGQCFSQPYLGTREFPARFEKATDAVPCPISADLGVMLHSIDYTTNPRESRWFHAELVDGVLSVPRSGMSDEELEQAQVRDASFGSMLQRLAAYARANPVDVPAFYRDREIRWKLTVPVDRAGTVTGPVVLGPLADPERPKRGVIQSVPSSTRTVGVSPNLAADDVQYVLGWGDDNTRPERVAECHRAFVDLIGDWADSVPAQDDPVPHQLRELYRSGALDELERPEGMQAKDGVAIVVGDEYAHCSSSAAGFWREHVGAVKGSGREGMCMICCRVRPLANTIPGKVRAALVPGARNDAALVSVNERVFGYDLTAQLTHTPICLACADDIMAALTGILSDPGQSITLSGQDSRLAWWVVDGDDYDYLGLINGTDDQDPDPAEAAKRFASINQGKAPKGSMDSRFCWLAVGGNVGRIMVREWADIGLVAQDNDAVSYERNVDAWFADHRNTPSHTTAFTTRDGRSIPAGTWFHRPVDFALCLGRWDPKAHRYAPFGAKNADRPDGAFLHVLQAAVLGRRLPAAMNEHLFHRIRNDGRIDDRRAALARLFLNRARNRPKDTEIPTMLNETYTDPAYLSGRLFAALERIQTAAHRRPTRIPKNQKPQAQSVPATTGSVGESEERAVEVNSTFGDRYLRRAIDTPAPVLTQGRKESVAWLTKIRRRDGAGRAAWYANRLAEIYAGLSPEIGGVPSRTTPRQKNMFILGYQHESVYRPVNKTDDSTEA